MRLRAWVAGLVSLGLAGLLAGRWVQAEPAATALRRTLTAAAAPIWVVDKAASRLTFRGAAGGQPFDGVFKSWDAEIAFDPNNLRASRAVVTVDVASAVTGDPNRDQALPGPDGFAAARFPQASFVSSSIAPAGPGRYLAAGELSIKGLKRRMVLPISVGVLKDRATLLAAFALSRRAFNLGEGRSASPDTADAVQVSVRLVAKKAR